MQKFTVFHLAFCLKIAIFTMLNVKHLLMALHLRRKLVNIPGKKGEKLKLQTELVCIWCGTAFWTFRSDAKTCSGSCRVLMCIDNKKKRL